MNLPGTQPPGGQTAAKAQVKQWVTEALPPGDTRTVLVTELACSEPGCPPTETVIALLGGAETQQWKLHKPVTEVTEDDVRVVDPRR